MHRAASDLASGKYEKPTEPSKDEASETVNDNSQQRQQQSDEINKAANNDKKQPESQDTSDISDFWEGKDTSMDQEELPPAVIDPATRKALEEAAKKFYKAGVVEGKERGWQWREKYGVLQAAEQTKTTTTPCTIATTTTTEVEQTKTTTTPCTIATVTITTTKNEQTKTTPCKETATATTTKADQTKTATNGGNYTLIPQSPTSEHHKTVLHIPPTDHLVSFAAISTKIEQLERMVYCQAEEIAALRNDKSVTDDLLRQLIESNKVLLEVISQLPSPSLPKPEGERKGLRKFMAWMRKVGNEFKAMFTRQRRETAK
ncbi:hypothetical protein HDV05_004797 [Chytridiales sp. JEL 0842]|nr:hypothetical protein HDV05_004797 [Chytridiales sp. JEL 0842]